MSYHRKEHQPPLKWLVGAFIVVLIALGFAVKASAQNVTTYVHPNALELAPLYKKELEKYFPDIPMPWYTLALTEHESCITLKHSRCMSPKSSFVTKWADTGNRREQGVGLAMITRAWKSDGTLRMDTLGSLKKLYPEELKDLNWDNIASRPDLQIRAQILLLRSDFEKLYEIKGPLNRLYMTDSAYNGGISDVNKARKVCGLTTGCNPQIWFGNVEKYCVKSKKVLYGNRSACDINTHHVYDVIKVRSPKYKSVLPELFDDPDDL